MGDLSRHRAEERFRVAIAQRQRKHDDSTEDLAVYREAVDELVDIATDPKELDKVTRSLATDPDAIDFPDTL